MNIYKTNTEGLKELGFFNPVVEIGDIVKVEKDDGLDDIKVIKIIKVDLECGVVWFQGVELEHLD